MSKNSFLSFMEDNPSLTISGAIIGVILIGSFLLRNKNATATATSGPTDSNGNRVVYVPTSTVFETINKGNTTTTTTNPPPPPVHTPGPPPVPTPIPVPGPHPPPPVHAPPPPPPVKKTWHLEWGAIHTVTSDDTRMGTNALSYIAGNSTRIMQQTQHAPSSVRITASDIASHNHISANARLQLGQRLVLPSYVYK